MIRKVLKSILHRDDDRHEFKPLLTEIETRPVNPLGHCIFWVIVLTIISALGWLYAGEIDVVVSARGKIIPSGEIKILQPLDTGVISQIRCKPGDYVERNQVLLEIDPSSTEPTLASSRIKLRTIETEMKRLQAAVNGKPFRRDMIKDDPLLSRTQADLHRYTMDSFQKLIDAKSQEVEKINTEMGSELAEREKTLVFLETSRTKEKRLRDVLDIIARDTYDNIQNEVANYERTLEEIQFRIDGLTKRRQQLLHEIDRETADFKKTHLQELAERQKGASDLKAEIERIAFIHRKQQITSPISGHVNELFITTLGGVVTPAQKLLSIVPLDSPLIVEALILNQDIGFVSEGMPVTIKVDAYEFQKYGTLKGTVKQISRDSIVDERLGPVFKAYIDPEEKEFIVADRRVCISSGLTVTAEIKVGRRRIIEFFIYPLIKSLDEGISVR